MKIISTGKTIDHTLKYRNVRFHSEEVGRLPNDIFLSSKETPPLESLKKVRPVMVEQPEMINGAPNVTEVSQRFTASAPSPLVSGAIGAVIGGVAGAVIGGFVSVISGNGAFLLGAGSLGLAAGSYLGASNASNQEVQLVVSERPILSQTMTGTDTRVREGNLKGRSGYFHTFHARLQSDHLGTYDVPKIQTIRKGSS